MTSLETKVEKVRSSLRKHSPVLIAYSGGVDSATLLAIAMEKSDFHVEAMIADSPSLPRRSYERALEQSKRLGAILHVIATKEMEDAKYIANPLNRCYYCKAELFQQMHTFAHHKGFRSIAYGENADDLAADRPGSLAALEFSVLAPLRDADIGKSEVRILASNYQLFVADEPSQPCLSSRIPFGTQVTSEALALIERAEDAVRDLGFRILRVRHHESPNGPHACVQIGVDELPNLLHKGAEIQRLLKQIGYVEVALDPLGYRGVTL